MIFFFFYFSTCNTYRKQIKEEGFLEDVNNMLNSGEVPNIFGADEKAELCEKMRVVSNMTIFFLLPA